MRSRQRAVYETNCTLSRCCFSLTRQACQSIKYLQMLMLPKVAVAGCGCIKRRVAMQSKEPAMRAHVCYLFRTNAWNCSLLKRQHCRERVLPERGNQPPARVSEPFPTPLSGWRLECLKKIHSKESTRIFYYSPKVGLDWLNCFWSLQSTTTTTHGWLQIFARKIRTQFAAAGTWSECSSHVQVYIRKAAGLGFIALTSGAT